MMASNKVIRTGLEGCAQFCSFNGGCIIMPSFSNFINSISPLIADRLVEEFKLMFWREPLTLEELLEVLE